MRNLSFLISEAERNFHNELFDSVEAQRNSETTFSYQVKAQPNFRHRDFTTQCKYRIFFELREKKVNHLLNKADIY